MVKSRALVDKNAADTRYLHDGDGVSAREFRLGRWAFRLRQFAALIAEEEIDDQADQ